MPKRFVNSMKLSENPYIEREKERVTSIFAFILHYCLSSSTNLSLKFYGGALSVLRTM